MQIFSGGNIQGDSEGNTQGDSGGNIQGDSGEVNILRGDSIGQCEKKRVHTKKYQILNGYRDRSV